MCQGYQAIPLPPSWSKDGSYTYTCAFFCHFDRGEKKNSKKKKLTPWPWARREKRERWTIPRFEAHLRPGRGKA